MLRLLLLSALLALGACASKPVSHDPYRAEMAQAAFVASAAQEQFAQTRNARANTGLTAAERDEAVRAATITPESMRVPIRLDTGFTGEVHEALRIVTRASGWTLLPDLGRTPLEAVIVHLPPGTFEAMTVLRNINWQSGAAGVSIAPSTGNKTLQVVYRAN